ncbi:MAG TPA: flippase-like domain-containing protein [Anaerolineales bacterium]|nr:flippase-like domain-containing protein [Anaerolineae bacterium]HIQ01137.1 flippase-like domain-containing protein [Anaerolineales bacterium]
MNRKKWLNLARVLISVGALSFLLWRIGLGETLAVLRGANLRLLLAAFGLFLGSLVIRAGRWAVLLYALNLRVPFRRLVYLYFVGAFFNSFLPTGFGGDVVRALELTQDTPTPAAVGTVLVDRMTGLLVLLALGLGALPFSATYLAPWLVWLLVAVAGGGLLAGGLLLEGRLLRRATAWLPERFSLTGSGPLGRLYAAITGCGWRAVGQALGISLVFNLVNILINFLCGRAVGIDLGPGYFFITAPIISISLMVPISVGGVGIRDWVVVALFGPAGVDSNTAAGMSLSIYAVSAAGGLVGGLMYGVQALREMRRRGG